MRTAVFEYVFALCFLFAFYTYYPDSSWSKEVNKFLDKNNVEQDSIKSKPTSNNLTLVWDENSHPTVDLHEYSTISVDSIRNDSVYVHISN